MLGLSTHEPNFCVIREAFMTEFEKQCTRCGKQGHLVSECPERTGNQKTVTLA
jgi:5'-3' exonuclease